MGWTFSFLVFTEDEQKYCALQRFGNALDKKRDIIIINDSQ